jgi:tRNA (cytidine/uridine-2'-O-)-methyltransferase
MTLLHVVLVEPEIPHNTGAIARLCLATRAQLHLVGRLGFRIDDKSLRRAGLDYWQHVQIQQHPTFDDFAASFAGSIFLYEARTGIDYDQSRIDGPTALVFGSETRGLSDSILTRGLPTYRLPIYDDRVRSLNLANTVGIVLYDALAQLKRAGHWGESEQ